VKLPRWQPKERPQNGHWKSPKTIITTGAVGEPLDAAPSIETGSFGTFSSGRALTRLDRFDVTRRTAAAIITSEVTTSKAVFHEKGRLRGTEAAAMTNPSKPCD
jgi:hypothetical protein